MSPAPQLFTSSPIAKSSFNRTQIDQINAFFSSTAGAITFSIFWLFCLIGMLLVGSWMWTTQEEESRRDPEMARQRANQARMLLDIQPQEMELPIINNIPKLGKYQRFH